MTSELMRMKLAPVPAASESIMPSASRTDCPVGGLIKDLLRDGDGAVRVIDGALKADVEEMANNFMPNF